MTTLIREQCIAWARACFADAAKAQTHTLMITFDELERFATLAYAAGAAAEIEKIMLDVWQPVKGKPNGQS